MSGITGITNTAALNIQNSYAKNTESASKAGRALSTGSRLNDVSTDASSKAISEKLRTNIDVLSQAKRNVAQGDAVLKVAIGGLGNIQDLLTTMKALTTKANNGTMDTTSLALADTEYQAMLTQVNTIATESRWGTTSLLTGGAAGTAVGAFSHGFTAALNVSAPLAVYTFVSSTSGVFTLTNNGTSDTFTHTCALDAAQTFTIGGINITLDATYLKATAVTSTSITTTNTATSMSFEAAEQAGDMFALNINGANVTALSLTGSSLTSVSNAAAASALVDTALTTINTNLTSLGAQQRQLEAAANNLTSTIESNVSARAVFNDADIAQESTKLSTSQVFAQLSISALTKMQELQQGLASMLR